MQQLTQPSTSRLFSMASRHAEIQVVAANDILLDVQTSRADVLGHFKLNHATCQLSLDEAIQLEQILADAITAASASEDPRQTRLWGPTIERRRKAV